MPLSATLNAVGKAVDRMITLILCAARSTRSAFTRRDDFPEKMTPAPLRYTKPHPTSRPTAAKTLAVPPFKIFSTTALLYPKNGAMLPPAILHHRARISRQPAVRVVTDFSREN